MQAVTKLRTEKLETEQIRSNEFADIESKATQVSSKWQQMSKTYAQVEDILNDIANEAKTTELTQLARNFANGTHDITTALKLLNQSINPQPSLPSLGGHTFLHRFRQTQLVHRRGDEPR
jgi:hypothetical protein